MLFKTQSSAGGNSGYGFASNPGDALEDATALKLRIHQRLLEILNLSLLDKATREQLRPEVRSIIAQLLLQEKRLLTNQQAELLLEDVLDELLGLGPLEPLLKDDTVDDILINTHSTVYVERAGRLEKTDVRFLDTRHVLRIVNKIVSAVGRRIDESQPMVDARLADGSRINAIIPPLAVDGPLVSIRKFSRTPIHMERLVELSAITEDMAKILRLIVRCRRSMLISGGTGAGKTTFLNALSAFVDHRERIVTIEDSAELQLQQPHVGRLETRPPNIEGKGEVTPRELVRNALRMRPDRIIVGEVRTGEAFDMLQAMNTGHEGCMTTVHANSPRDALSRLEQMIGMAGLEITPRSIRRQIASAIHVIIQLERMDDGRRRVVSVSEIVGMEEDIIMVQEVFRFRRTGHGQDGAVLGQFEATGVRPKFMDHVMARGAGFPPTMFAPGRKLD
jgi:pilus assembly protein CpaF